MLKTKTIKQRAKGCWGKGYNGLLLAQWIKGGYWWSKDEINCFSECFQFLRVSGQNPLRSLIDQHGQGSKVTSWPAHLGWSLLVLTAACRFLVTDTSPNTCLMCETRRRSPQGLTVNDGIGRMSTRLELKHNRVSTLRTWISDLAHVSGSAFVYLH